MSEFYGDDYSETDPFEDDLYDDQLVDRDDPVLVLIDLQERLMPAVADQETVIENVVRLVKFAGLMGMPVVVTEQKKLGPAVAPLREVLADYSPVEKVVFNCFDDPVFVERLVESERRTMILTGAETHICIVQTALQGLNNGYRVQVVADAVSSRTVENRERALTRLGMAGVPVTTTEMLIFEMVRRADIDEFKSVLNIIK